MDSNLKSRLNACFENVLSEWNQELSPPRASSLVAENPTSIQLSAVFTSVLLFLCGICVGALVTFYWLEDTDPFMGKDKEDK